jgi:hypothetical protein
MQGNWLIKKSVYQVYTVNVVYMAKVLHNND